MPEVDEATLAILRQSHALLQKVNGDPRSRPLLEDAVKLHHPELRTERETVAGAVNPHLEAFRAEVATPLMDELKAMREEREARQRAEVEGSLNASFADLRKRGFTDEGVDRIKTLMVERNIADVSAAAALFNEMNPAPAAEQPGFTPQSWNIEQVSDIDVKGLFENEDAWGDRVAAQTLNEIRLGQSA